MIKLNSISPSGKLQNSSVRFSFLTEEGVLGASLIVDVDDAHFEFIYLDSKLKEELIHYANLHFFLNTFGDLRKESIAESARYFDAGWFALVIRPFSSKLVPNRCTIDLFVDEACANPVIATGVRKDRQIVSYLKFRMLTTMPQLRTFTNALKEAAESITHYHQ